jgi:hypothetical protein
MQQPGILNTSAFLLTVGSATRAAAQRDRAIAAAIDNDTRAILRDTDRRLADLSAMLDLLDDDDDDA